MLFLLKLCSYSYMLLNLCLGIMLFSFGVKDQFVIMCLAYMLPCGEA
jgi:hypothetical protein